MTLDEAIKHCKEEAEKYMEYGIETECYQCGKKYEQLAEWLTELKVLRESSVAEEDYISLKYAFDDAKGLLKLAVEDLTKIPCNNDVYIPSSCDACIKQGNCDYSDSFKWRYADEALKLLNEEI